MEGARIISEPIRQRNFYNEWVARQGIPVIEGYFVEDVNSVELEPWEERGGKGAFINLIGTGESNDTYICEIPDRIRGRRPRGEAVVR